MVRAREVSPSELVELYLERISRIEPKLNAYRVVLGEQARADAKRAEERLALRRARRRCSGCRSRSRTTSTTRAR